VEIYSYTFNLGIPAYEHPVSVLRMTNSSVRVTYTEWKLSSAL